MGKLLLATTTVAIGATAAAAESPRRSVPKNPSDTICRETPVTGSRVDVKRIRIMRLQSDDQRRDTRDAVDRAQMQQTIPKG